MTKFHKHLHHAKKRLKHPEIKGIIILAILTLIIPILVIVLSQPTQIKQNAATQKVVATQTQCELNGDVCTPGNYVAMSGGKCSNGQSPLSFSCNAGYVCCRPGVSFPNGSGGNKCGGCQGQICPNAGQYCEEPIAQNNQFAIYLCNQTNGVWQFQYNQTGSQTCTWSTPATGGNTGASDLCTSYATSDNATCGTAIHGNPDTIYKCSTVNGVRKTVGTISCSGLGCSVCGTGKNDVCGSSCTKPNSGSGNGIGQSCNVLGITGKCAQSGQCANGTTETNATNSGCIAGLVCCVTNPPVAAYPQCNNSGSATDNSLKYVDAKGNPVKTPNGKPTSCSSWEICNNDKSTPPEAQCTPRGCGTVDKSTNQASGFCAKGGTCSSYNTTGTNATQFTSTPDSNDCNSTGGTANDCCEPSANITIKATPQGAVTPGATPTINGTATAIPTQHHAFNIKNLFSPKAYAAQVYRFPITLTYDPNSKLFIENNVSLNNLPAGDYQIYLKLDKYLAAKLIDTNGSDSFTIAPGSKLSPQIVSLVPGDIAPQPHGDNFIDLNDYNALITCYNRPATGNCKLADLNNDGKIDENDFQLLIGNFERFGDSYTEPNFTCTQDPTCQTGTGSIQLCALKCTKVIDF